MAGTQYRKDKGMVGSVTKVSEPEPAPGLIPAPSTIQYKEQDKKATELLVKMNSAIAAEKAAQAGKRRNGMTRYVPNDPARTRN